MEIVGSVALIGLDNPPVNAASHALRAAQAEASVAVIALFGRGRALAAGADIRAFGRTARAPLLPEVAARHSRT